MSTRHVRLPRRVFRAVGAFAPAVRDRVSVVVLALAAVVGTMLEASALGLVAPTALAIADGRERVDQDLGPITLDQPVAKVIGLAALLLLGSMLFQFVQSFLRGSVLSRVEAERRVHLLEAYLRASWSTQSIVSEGRLQEVQRNITRSVAGLSALVGMLKAVCSLTVFLVAALVIDPLTAAAMLIVGIAIAGLLLPVTRRIRWVNAQMARINMRYSENVGEACRITREIDTFGANADVNEALEVEVEEWRSHRRRAAILNDISGPIYQYLGLMAILVGLFVLAEQRPDEAAAAGASALILLRSIGYGQTFQQQVQTLLGQLPYATVARDELAKLDRQRRAGGTRRVDHLERLELHDVHYTYPGAHTPALTGLSLDVSVTEAVGLVGPSGGGKSTLAQILLRLRVPTRGCMAINGLGAEQYDLDSWYRTVSFVPQQPLTIRGSLFQNVALYRDWVTRDRVEEALAEAGLVDLLADLEEGLDGPVGPGRRELSGGQQQRLGIARALAGDPALVVFDEPTSALDLSTEATIQATLATLKGRVGLVVIAHRLSTLSLCERLVVLESGEVTFDGPSADAFTASPFLAEADRLGRLSARSADGGPMESASERRSR